MKQTRNYLTLLPALLLVVAGWAGAEGDFLLHGRISFDTGALLVQGANDTEWAAAAVNTLVMPGDTLWVDEQGTAELEMAGLNFLRFADGSKAELVSFPPSAYVRGWTGSFYVHRLSRSQGSFIFTSPAATVDVAEDSMVRLDIDEAGAMVVSVRWGRAVVRTDMGGDVTATESTRVWVDPGYLPSDPVAFDRGQGDAFDDWNNDRAQLLAGGVSTVPQEVAIQPTTVGAQDLNRYGEWVHVDNRPYWRPTVVTNYVPYRHGYWNYAPAVGHVWVGEYPFAYVTSHYGRWRHTTSYGWLWSYDPVWSPAWVASVRVGNYYMWSPVDYYHRPVIVAGAATFAVGGISFCWTSTSYTSANYLYAGPAYIYSPARAWVTSISAMPYTNIHIWNISRDPRRRPAVPFNPRHIAGRRDYNPPRSIRGITGTASRGFAPEDRARRLESQLGRNTFATARQQTGSPVRTAMTREGRMAAPRNVRLNQTEQTYLPRQRSDAPTAARTAALVPESQRLGRSPAGPTGIRSERGPQTGPGTRSEAPRRDMAIRDLESSAPAPRGSGQLQRTPVRTEQGLPDRARGIAPTQRQQTAPPSGVRTSPAPQQRTAPAPGVRSTPAPQQRTAPSAGVRTTPTPQQRTAPAPTVRSAPAPQQRTAPAPTVRSAPAPQQRTAPAPTVRSAPAPQQRTAPAPSVRSMPAPQQRTAPAPSVRSMPAPQQRSAPSPAPRMSAPQQRSAPAPSVRSMPAPQQRSAPSPAPRMSAPQQRSAPSPAPRMSAPSTRSAPSPAPRMSAPSPRSAPSPAPRMSAPSPRSAPSMPSPRSGGSAPSRGGGPRGR